MFATLVSKELKAILLSPKFAATFALCSVLMLLSVFVGIMEYRAAQKSYESAVQLTDQRMHSASGWRGLTGRVDRKPDPLQIFAAGITYDVGRYTGLSEFSSVKLNGSQYSEESIYALFRYIDFAFIVQVVLSLFAILFTFDAVSGEREDGTLRLVFSNAVPRARYLVAKCAGAWLGLVVPISIPILLSLLAVVLFGVPMAGSDWLRLSILLVVALLFFTFFIAVGVLLSTLSKRSSVSFLLGLVTWVAFVLIIPRVATATAAQFVRVPPAAEIDGMKDAYSKDQWAKFQKSIAVMSEQMHQQGGSHQDLTLSIDSAQQSMTDSLDRYSDRLNQDLSRRKTMQERLALSLSRVSPVSAFQLAAMTLSGNDLSLKTRTEEAMSEHRSQFVDYKNTQMASDGNSGAIKIAMGPDGLKVTVDRKKGQLDLSGMPAYVQPTLDVSHTIKSVIVDIGILLLGSILAFGGAYFAFARYDVR